MWRLGYEILALLIRDKKELYSVKVDCQEISDDTNYFLCRPPNTDQKEPIKIFIMNDIYNNAYSITIFNTKSKSLL